MFKSVFLLGHIRGIRIEVHVSWLVIFVLLLAALGTGLARTYEHWSPVTTALTTLLTVLTFFASILAHELGHSLVALRRGVTVRAITLFIFGGVAQLEQDSESARDEFWIAIAGPAVSFALAAIFGLLAILTAGLVEPLSVGLGWLALINLVVAVFNLVPGFPLDGGRVFRALVWHLTGNAETGMKAAVMGGRLVAYALFGLGLWSMLALGNLIGGLWIMLIAWFLLNSAEASGRGWRLRSRLAGLKARDLAETEVPLVAHADSVASWIENQVLPRGERSAMVSDGGTIVGLITLSDARQVPREDWPMTRIDRIMTARDKLHTVDADAGADQVLALMTRHQLNQVPVMSGSRLYGWIDRQRLLRMIDLHMEVRA